MRNNFLTEFNFTAVFGKQDTLAALDLSWNQISSLTGEFALTNLSALELSSNSMTRFFVQQFFNRAEKNLTINLYSNDLESVDFRGLQVLGLENAGQLSINFGPVMRCNCHTASLLHFLNRKLSLDKRVYSKLVVPEYVRCSSRDEPQTFVYQIADPKNLSCPLDLPHIKLCPKRCVCNRNADSMTLEIACSQISEVPMLPTYKNLRDIQLQRVVLDISNNALDNLPSKRYDLVYNEVIEIVAYHNHFKQITVDNIPDKLMKLDLKANLIKFVSPEVIARFSQLEFLQISANPWNCTQSTELVKFVKENRHIVRDFTKVSCFDGRYFLEVDVEGVVSIKVCFLLAIALFLIFSLVVSTVVIFSIKWNAISEWIFNFDSNHVIESIRDKFKVFDATIVVADCEKVFGKYIQTKLMSQPNKYKIQLILKDWPADDEIPAAAMATIRKSKRTIVILSKNLLENNWKRWNYFNIGNRVIFVVRERTTINHIDVSNKFFVNFHDPWFWDKFKHLMSHQSELVMNDVELQPLTGVTTV